VREDAVDDHGVEDDDEHGESNGDDTGHGDGNAFMFGERVVQGVVVEGEGLVEGFDLVYEDKDSQENTAFPSQLDGRVGRGEEEGGSHDDDIVNYIPGLGQLAALLVQGVATHENMTFLGRRFLEKGRRSGSLLFHSSTIM
jgi:hypothetical protein